jgi:Glyoxalase/Bleomycin resistance protein/Dioxygenase superfamily.
MIVGLDHVVVLVHDIEAASSAYAALLGRKPAWRSADQASASVLFTLDNMSVELLAPAAGAAGDHIRSTIDANGEGLASLCLRVEDIANWHRRLDRLGLKPEAIGDGGSRNCSTARRCLGSAPARRPMRRMACGCFFST